MRAARRGLLIHISTDYVFDGAKAAPYLESDPPAPLGVYGASKLAGERAVAERLERHIILRTSWVFSATGANFVKTMLRLAAAGRDIRVVQDQTGGPTPADDIAWAIAQIAARIAAGPVAWGTYHYCGTPAVSWYDFARAIFEVHGEVTGKHVAVDTDCHEGLSDGRAAAGEFAAGLREDPQRVRHRAAALAGRPRIGDEIAHSIGRIERDG